MCIKLSMKLESDKLYIISVSGGVDSMVLLDILFYLNISLIVVNFNHMQRKESFEEKKMIENYCYNNKIPFFYFEIDVYNILKKDNFHNYCRNFRQKKLKEIAFLNKTFYIITSHHLDDLSENIFMKLARGSNLLGYSGGMQLKTKIDDFYFLKPLLYVAKKDILHYAKKNNIIYSHDVTNDLDIYKRNQIRHHIIPWFKKNDVNFLKHIKNFHFQLLEAYDFIRLQTKKFFSYHSNPNNLNLNLFLNLSSVVQKDVILFLFENKDIAKNFYLINNIIVGLNNIKKPNLFWDLTENYQLIKSYKNFFLFNKNQIEFYNYSKPILYVTTSLKLINSVFQYYCFIMFDDESFLPLRLRKRKNGDILKFSFGSKKLKSFFIDKKIPLKKRNNIWLIVDKNDQIIWIPNIYINKTLGIKNQCYLFLKK